MNYKTKKIVPLILLILMILVILPQTFATDTVANDNTLIEDTTEEIIINESNDNTELSSNVHNMKNNVLSSPNKEPSGNYWIMTMDPTEVTYNDAGCNVHVTTEMNGFSAAVLLYYWIDGTKTTTAVRDTSNTQVYANNKDFTVNLAGIFTSSLFSTDGTYIVTFRPEQGESYMGYSFNDITPEFGSVKVTVGSGGSTSSKTATTLTVDNEEGEIIGGTLITGSLKDTDGNGISKATINYKENTNVKSVITDDDGNFVIVTGNQWVSYYSPYTGFSYGGDDNYEASSVDKTFTLKEGSKEVNIVAKPTSVAYTSGTSSKISVSVSITGGTPSTGAVRVWIDDDTSKYKTLCSLSSANAPGVYTIDLDELKDDNNNDLSTTLASGSHSLNIGVPMDVSGFTVTPASVSVTGGSSAKVITTKVTPTTVNFVDGEDCILNVKVTGFTLGYSEPAVKIWVDGDEQWGAVQTGQKAGEDVSFTINLNTLQDIYGTTFKSKLKDGENKVIVGVRTQDLTGLSSWSVSNAEITVNVGSGSSKTATTLTVSTDTSITEGTSITGTLMAGTTPISEATINYKLDGSSKTTNTNSDGSFTISTTGTTGTYSDFSYAGDDTYEGDSVNKSIVVSADSTKKIYTSIPKVSGSSSTSYTKGESTIVTVTVTYDEEAGNKALDFYQSLNVFINPTSVTSKSITVSDNKYKVEIDGVDVTSKSYTFDLKEISDLLDDGENTLYFGPSAGYITNNGFDEVDYQPLTVTVSSGATEVTKYTTTPTVSGSSSVSYTKGESTVVNVKVEYPSSYEEDLQLAKKVFVYIDTISTSSRVEISGVTSTDKSFTYDLETIKDDLSVGEHTLYFGPNEGSLSGIDYNPLTVTVSDSGSSSKTATTLTVDKSYIYTGEDITGSLNDKDGKGIVGATINYKLGGEDKSVVTGADGKFIITTTSEGTYSSFSYGGDNDYASSSSSVTVTVEDQAKFSITITEDTIDYTPGTKTIIHVTFVKDAYTPSNLQAYVWINEDTSNQVLATDEDGNTISFDGSTSFTVDLSKLSYNFLSGKTYILTVGPEDGKENTKINDWDVLLSLDTITVTIPGEVKTETFIELDDTVVVEGSTISGKLVDEEGNTLGNKVISVSFKSRENDSTTESTITTGNDGTFSINNSKVGVYTLTFPEDSTYAKAINTVAVTYENKKVTVIITEDAITFKEGVSTSIDGRISDPNYIFWSPNTDKNLYVWIDGDLATQQAAYNSYGSNILMASSTFAVDLSKISGLEAGHTYTLTFGPKNGKYNSAITDPFYLYTGEFDSIIVKVTDKTLTKLTLDNTNIKATQDITGTLLDENDDPISNVDVSYVLNGETKTVKTGTDGKFTISNAVEGTYSNFKFVGDNTYEESTPVSDVTVTGPETTVLTVSKIDDTVFVGKSITGSLVDSEGNPIVNAVIKYTGPNGANTVTTDVSGVFTISNVILGEYKDFSYDANVNYKASSLNGVVTVITTPTYDGIIYVSKSGKDSNDGSESNPVLTIAKAIELAEYTTVHKIIISAGTYTEHDLIIDDPLTIIGIGNVIIDANKEGRIFDISGNNEVNLANLTLINGQTDNGGAIQITDAKVTIDSLTFRNNNATGYGGAISWAADEGIIKNSIFTRNSARTSGAINFGDGYSPAGTTGGKIINCTFDSNYAWWKTAAVSLYTPGEIINSTFKNNNASNPSGTAIESGALSIYANNCLITGSEFSNNYASGQGGAIHIDLGSDGTVINNSTFISNTGNVGGAIEAQGSNIIIANSTFSKNHATSSGGAIDVLLNYDSDEGVFIYNNIFESNVADGDGGAISFDGSESFGYDEGVFIENNKFIKNTATSGGAIAGDSDSVLNIKNNEFNNNSATESGGAIIDGKLTLDTNTMVGNTAPTGNSIFLQFGSIESDITLTFVDVSALTGDTIVLTAVLTDDNENTVVVDGNSYWPGVYFTVNGVAVSGSLSRNGDNVTIEYEVTESQGNYAISGSLDSDFGTATVVDGTLEVVNQLNTILTVESKTIDYGASFTGTLTDINGKPLAGEEILYKYNGNVLKTTTNSEGVFTVSSASTGTYSDFSFAGGDSYLESESDSVVTVRAEVIPTPVPSLVNVSISDSSLNISDNTVTIHLSSSDGSLVNTGSVSLTVNGVTNTVHVIGGVAVFNNLNLSSGTYDAQVNYIASGNYTNVSKIVSITVPTVINNTNTTVDNGTNVTNNTNVSVSNLSTSLSLEFEELSDGHRLYGVLADENGNLLSDSVDITLSRLSNGQSKTYTVSSVNGEFSLPINLVNGDYRASARYNGRNIYLGSSSSNVLISLTDTPSNVILNDTDEVTGVYGEENKYSGVLTDKEGNALSGYHIALNITRLSSGASKVYYVTTDYLGNYIMPINLAPGVYTIRTSIDDNNFTGSALSSLIISSNDTVNTDSREVSVLRANTYESKYQSGEKFTGTLFNSLGYGIAGQHISITLSNSKGQSKTYEVVSDYKGEFSLPVNLARGSYFAFCTFTGTDIYAPSESYTVTLTVI